MTEKEFFGGESQTFTFADLLEEREKILSGLTSDNFLTRRVAVVANNGLELLRRYYVHQESVPIVKWIVIVWSSLVFAFKMIKPDQLVGVPTEETVKSELDAGSNGLDTETTSAEEQDNESTDEEPAGPSDNTVKIFVPPTLPDMDEDSDDEESEQQQEQDLENNY